MKARQEERFLRGSAVITAVFMPLAAYAESPDQRASDEIVVTANRREEDLSKIGFSVKPISGEALADRHITVTDRPFVIPSYAPVDLRLGY